MRPARASLRRWAGTSAWSRLRGRTFLIGFRRFVTTASIIRGAAISILGLGLVPPDAAGEDLASLLFGMEAAYARVQSYTARFVRQEVVNGSLRPREEALLKFQGREILFVPGGNDNRMLVREPGFFTGLATIVMAPDSPRVLRESRHPVTDIGIGQLIGLILDNAGAPVLRASSPCAMAARRPKPTGSSGGSKSFCPKSGRKATIATGSP